MGLRILLYTSVLKKRVSFETYAMFQKTEKENEVNCIYPQFLAFIKRFKS